MPTIAVENLLFEFPANWKASKFDDWTFYKRQFQSVCGGTKAIDLIAVEPKFCCWVIEAKDYRRHRRTKTIDLAEEIALKVRDTLAALVAANANATADDERETAAAAIRCPRLRVALHLEQPAKHSMLFPRAIDPAIVLQRLKQLVRAFDPHPLVVEMGRMTAVAWTVTPL